MPIELLRPVPTATVDERVVSTSAPSLISGSRTEGPVLRVTQPLINVRRGPRIDTAPVARLAAGVEVRVIGREGEWVKVALTEDRTGYIRIDMLEEVVQPEPGNESPD